MRIGNRQIIARERILIPKGERVEFESTYKDTPFKFAVEFHTEWKHADKSGIIWDSIDGVIRVRFFIKSPFPSITSGFQQLGTLSDGSRLLFAATHFAQGDVADVFIQVMVEEVARG